MSKSFELERAVVNCLIVKIGVHERGARCGPAEGVVEERRRRSAELLRTGLIGICCDLMDRSCIGRRAGGKTGFARCW